MSPRSSRWRSLKSAGEDGPSPLCFEEVMLDDIRIRDEDLYALLHERSVLRGQVTRLQVRCNELLEENREQRSKLQAMMEILGNEKDLSGPPRDDAT